ncbi:MAG: glycine betaine ABC transporter substrate-binding protein [Bacteroidales bacterium]|nr:glycine betaine ABC transporter substrate-binding protein [Bacteroidales bacterium]
MTVKLSVLEVELASTANTEKAIKEYNLDYKQVTSSGPAMVASLQKAYNSKEPIVITGWKPHHKWSNI